MILYALILLSIPAVAVEVPADELAGLKKDAPQVFLDCHGCDQTYIKSEINYVNYVREPREADLHILITSQGTASGGGEHTLTFIGQKRFDKQTTTLKYYSQRTGTSDENRTGLVKSLQTGLVPYLAQTSLARLLAVDLQWKLKTDEVKDKWRQWMFNIRTSTSLNKNDSYDRFYISGSVTASRITPHLKMNYNANASYNRSAYHLPEEEYAYHTENYGLSGTVVKSMGDHWSMGGNTVYSTSTYGNTKLSLTLAPAVEYDIFPYSEATRKQVCFFYKLGVKKVNYQEETIYDKWDETLFFQSLSVDTEITQPWGSVWGTLEGLHYFHDLSKNRLSLYMGLSVRLFKGMTVGLGGGYSRINDQLSLPKGELTQEEILLSLKQMTMTYSYNCYVSFSYAFGSIYSNVVNPRFSGVFNDNQYN